MKSASMPSLKMVPPLGMRDSISRVLLFSSSPATNPICECLLANGSLTTKTRVRESQGITIGWQASPPENEDSPDAILNREESHPVDPAPVDTIIPLEDCSSAQLS